MTGFLPSFTDRKDKQRVTKRPLVVFGIPSFTGAVEFDFVQCWTETLGALGAAGIPSHTMSIGKDPYLSKVRNRLTSDFLYDWPMATHLFFLDADIGWQPQKVVDLIKRDLDVIAGVYPKKNDELAFPVDMDRTEDDLPIERDGLYRARLAPTGFMCIKREVLEKLAAAGGQYFDTTGKAGRPQFNVFDMGCFTAAGGKPKPGEMGEFWGEDYYFCRKWRDMGGEVWIDPDIEFSHWGTKAWRGNFWPSLQLAVTEARMRHEEKTGKPVPVSTEEPVDEKAHDAQSQAADAG